LVLIRSWQPKKGTKQKTFGRIVVGFHFKNAYHLLRGRLEFHQPKISFALDANLWLIDNQAWQNQQSISVSPSANQNVFISAKEMSYLTI